MLELHYTSDFHYVSPYEGESGKGWGLGEGTATGDRLSGTVQWSNHPNGRGDGAMQPATRGVISTSDGATVMFDFTGRTLFVERDGETVGRQLLMTLLRVRPRRLPVAQRHRLHDRGRDRPGAEGDAGAGVPLRARAHLSPAPDRPGLPHAPLIANM